MRRRPAEIPQRRILSNRGRELARQAAAVLYVALMAGVLVAADVLFFSNRFWERLMANVGIVLVFLAFYLRFLGHP
jgi:uncharacterized membrane protein